LPLTSRHAGSDPRLKTAGLISPGGQESVTVALQAGTYDIYCGVPGHKALGMDVHITVS